MYKKRIEDSYKGGNCAKYNVPALECSHCVGGSSQTKKSSRKQQEISYSVKTQKGGDCGCGSQPMMLGGSRKSSRKQRGGQPMDYPFELEHHDYPEAPLTNFEITSNINSNFVSDKDLYGCGLKGGAKTQKKTTKKQIGHGFGYGFEMEHAITNRPEVVRYSTEGTGYGQKGGSYSNKLQKGGSYSNKLQKGGSYSNKLQKGGSGASDSLMEYFLDFQSRCRNSEIY